MVDCDWSFIRENALPLKQVLEANRRVRGMMGDFSAAAALLAASVFITASLTKLCHLSRFSGELGDYELLPGWAVWPMTLLVPIAELLSAVALYVPLPDSRRIGASCLLVLLCVFTIAIVTNLWRGRIRIRCACFGSRSQQLNWGLPVRNLLIAAALLGPIVAAEDLPEVPSAGGWAGAIVAATLAWVLTEAIRVGDVVTRARTA